MKRLFQILVLSFIVFIIGFFMYSYKIWNSKKYDVTEALIKLEKEVTESYRVDENKNVKIFDQRNILIGQFYLDKIKTIQKEKLKLYRNLVWAILSSEDKNFYKHNGLDYTSIFRAIWINFSNLSKIQGGSTITQQLAKMTMKLGKRNFSNKLAEMFCTFFIEKNFDKNTILSIYMNQIFLGEGNIGMEASSLYYFNKNAIDLTPQEAAMLVAIIPAPSVYNPIKNLKFALERQKIVLSSMRSNLNLYPTYPVVPKFDLTLRKFYRKYKIFIPKSKNRNEYRSKIGKFEVTDKNFDINKAPDFNSMIRNDIIKYFSDLFKTTSSLNVYTTLDYAKQKHAENALKRQIRKIRRDILLAKRNKISKKISDSINGSIVSVNPQNGFIEALVGSYEISSTGYRLNRAINASRQPGSTIKALTYAIALENRMISPSTLLKDEAINFNGYKPKNWYKGYRGYVPSRIAFTQSINTIAVKLFRQVGTNNFLNKIGRILSLNPTSLKERFKKNLTLSLGSGEVTPLELSLIYATIANEGKKVIPVQIQKITGKDDRLLYYYNSSFETETILEPTACAIVLNFLQGVLGKNGMIKVPFSENISLKMGGKTGTVEFPNRSRKKWSYAKGVKDTWFVGLIPNLTTVVWIGSDIVAPFVGSGSKTAAPVWLDYTQKIIYNTDLSKNLIKNQSNDYVLLDTCGDNGKVLLQGFTNCKEPLYGQYYYHGTEETLYNNSSDVLSEHNQNLVVPTQKNEILKQDEAFISNSEDTISNNKPEQQTLESTQSFEEQLDEVIDEFSILEEDFIEDIGETEQKSISELIEIEKEQEWLNN